MHNEHGLGLVPTERDPRDWLFRGVADDVLGDIEPKEQVYWQMRDASFRINQYRTGTCTGMSIINNFITSPRPHLAFPQLATVVDAEAFAIQAYIEFSGDASLQGGYTTEGSLDWTLSKGYASAYYRCSTTDDIIQALQAGPVIFASAWLNSMDYLVDRAWTDNYYLRINPDSGIRGYHQYLATGYDLEPHFEDARADTRPFIRVLNSWGPMWAKNGTARIFLDDLSVLSWWAYMLTEKRF